MSKRRTLVILSSFLLGLACGKTELEAPSRQPINGKDPRSNDLSALSGNTGTNCTELSCPEVEKLISKEGDVSGSDLLGKVGKQVSWSIIVNSDIPRKLGIRLDPLNSPSEIKTRYTGGNKSCDKVAIDWTPRYAESDVLNFKAVDISECIAKTELTDSDLQSCADLEKCSEFEVDLTVNYTILEDLNTEDLESENDNDSAWKEAAATAVISGIGTIIEAGINISTSCFGSSGGSGTGGSIVEVNGGTTIVAKGGDGYGGSGCVGGDGYGGNVTYNSN